MDFQTRSTSQALRKVLYLGPQASTLTYEVECPFGQTVHFFLFLRKVGYICLLSKLSEWQVYWYGMSSKMRKIFFINFLKYLFCHVRQGNKACPGAHFPSTGCYINVQRYEMLFAAPVEQFVNTLDK